MARISKRTIEYDSSQQGTGIVGPPGPAAPPPAWEDIEGKPSVFPPSPHTHDWDQVTGKPSSFPPSDHGHTAISHTGTDQEHAEVVTAAGVQVSALLRKSSGVFAGLQLVYDAVAGYCKTVFTGKKRGSVGLYDYPGALIPGPSIAPNIVDRSENALGVDPFLTVSNLDTLLGDASFRATPSAAGIMPPQAYYLQPRTITATAYQLTAQDNAAVLCCAAAGAITVTVPDDALLAGLPHMGVSVLLLQQGVGTITVQAATGVTLLASGGERKSARQNAVLTLVRIAANTWVLGGEKIA